MKGSQILEQQLAVIVSRLRQDGFGGRDAPDVTLADGTTVDASGALIGAFEVRIRKRNGEMALLHRQSMDSGASV